MKRKKRKEKNILYRFAMFLMCCILAVLLYLINDAKQIVTKASLKNFKLSSITQLLFWENLFFDEKASVASTISYTLLKDHYYSNGSNTLNAIMDGVIIKVEDDSVVQLCDNGVSVVYSEVEKIRVKENDRILCEDVLGSILDSVEMYFYYEDEEITLEEALAIK